MRRGRIVDVVYEKDGRCFAVLRQDEDDYVFRVKVPVKVKCTDSQIERAVVDICAAGLSRRITELLNPVLEGKQLPARFFRVDYISVGLN